MARILVSALADSVDAPPGQKFHVAGGGLDGITVPGFPFVFGRLSSVIALALEAGERQVLLTAVVTDPDAKVLVQMGAQINRVDYTQAGEIWLGLNFPPLNLTLAGSYKVSVRTGESEHSRILTVQVEANPAPHLPAGGQVH